MTLTHLVASRIRDGQWEGEFSGDEPPSAIELWHAETRIETAKVRPGGNGTWLATAFIPAGVLSDGVQTFLILDGATGGQLGQFSIVAGVPLEQDLRAEIDLLRAELDMLKRAFRRHCREMGGG